MVKWVLACCVRCWACRAARYSFLSSNSYLRSDGYIVVAITEHRLRVVVDKLLWK